MFTKAFTGFLFLFFWSLSVFSQTVYEHISNENIYEFLDEMANEKYIQLNDIIKPYSRKFIYEKLSYVNMQAANGSIILTKRQKKELKFYLQAFILESNDVNLQNSNKYKLFLDKKQHAAFMLNPPGLLYKDSLFSLALQPILGASYSTNSNGTLKHTYGFASMYGYIGKHLGFYGNVRDNDVNRVMVNQNYFVQTPGAIYKTSGNVEGIQFSESRGGIIFNDRWITVGLVKDHIQWGTGYNGTNIQSAHAPSFAHLVFQMKPVRWFQFNYYHGWLTSDVVDSASSYWTNNTYRVVFFNKYMAANMFTFYPVKFLNLSFGNSIVYTNETGGGPKAVFFIPFLFFKSVDVALSDHEKYGYASNNNQLFINISSRNIKHLHLYFSLFADDVSVSYFFDKNLYNSFSYKLGFRLSNFFIHNVSFTLEYTKTNPYVYQHHTQTQDYTSNSYNMGHYLRDNSQEYYFLIRYIPLRGLSFNLSYTLAQHGDDYDINDPNSNPHSDPILKNIIWQNNQFTFSAKYEIVSNAYFYFNYRFSNITGNNDAIQKYTPEYYQGKTNTFTIGANIGF